jgi:hypothetical protein
MNSVKTQRKQTESIWKNHQWFIQAFESGIMDHNFTVKSDLIGGIALFTGRGLLLSSVVAQVVAAIGAILASAMAYVQRIGATLLLGISLGSRSDRFPSPRLFEIVIQTSEYFIVRNGRTWAVTGLFTNNFFFSIPVFDPAISLYEIRKGIPAASGHGGTRVCHGIKPAP